MAIKIIGSTIIDDSRNIVNAGIATVTSVSIGNTQVVSSERQLQNIASLDATTTATIEAAIQNAPNTFTDLQVTGVSTLGITTFTGAVSFGTSAYFGDNDSLYFGDGNDLEIYHSGGNSFIVDAGTGNLVLGSNGDRISFVKGTGSETLARFNVDDSIELWFNNSKKFETTGYGATIFGVLQTQGLNVSGVATVNSDLIVNGNTLFADATNNRVGIGTTIPQSALDVRGAITVGVGTVGINSIFSTTDIPAWQYTNKSKAAGDSAPAAVYVGSAGTALYVVGDTANAVIQYTLSTPYDVSTAGAAVATYSVATQETNPAGIDFDPTGTKMFISGLTGVAPLIAGGEYVHEYSLSIAWDLSSGVGYTTSYNVTEDTAPQGVAFGNNGSKMYVVGSTGDAVYQYSLSTPYSLASGVTYDSISLILGTAPLLLETAPIDISFNSTGTVLWVLGQANDRIYEFHLGTAWDISTAVFYDDVYVGFNDIVVTGLQVIPEQNAAYIVGTSNDTVFQYSTNTSALEIASSGISSVSSIVLNNETRVKDKLYVKGLAHFDDSIRTQASLFVDSNLTVSGGSITAGNVATGLLGGNTTTNITMASGQTTGTLIVGSASQTGTMTFGQSTATQTINIQAGATSSGNTKTINLGTGGLSGSRTLITVGSAVAGAASTVTIPSPTNLLIGAATTTGTASQPLQVTGGAYISDNLGVGNTNPEYNLHIIGTTDPAGMFFDAYGNVAANIAGRRANGTLASPTGVTTNNNLLVLQGGGYTTGSAFANAKAVIFMQASEVWTSTAQGTHIDFDTTLPGTTTRSNKLRIDGYGNILVGSSSSTGTASQPLQVSGGAYVSGNLGVGATNPTGSKLIVANSAKASEDNALFFLSSSDGTNPFQLLFRRSNNVVSNPYYSIQSVEQNVGFRNLVLNNLGGNVTIGSTLDTGTALQTLQVTGGAYVSSGIGIGTTNPQEQIHSQTNTATNFIRLDNSSSRRAYFGVAASNDVEVNAADNSNLIFKTFGTERGRFNTSGNLGIGTTNPTSRLTVQGDILASGIVTAAQFSTGSGNLGFTTDTISGPSIMYIDPSPVGVGTTSGIVRILGDLYVDGTQFIVNSTTIELADFNVGIATTVGTNLLLDGAGIGIGSANIRKTITWNNTAGALTSSEDWNLASGKQYEINGTSVLSSTTLGSGVVNSSLTSVGTLGQLQVTGVSTFTNGPVLIGTATSTGTASQPLQVTGGGYFSGSAGVGIGITNPVSKLVLAGETVQFPNSLLILSTLHATSRRAAIGLGGTSGSQNPDWLILQDTNGNGTKDFAIYSGAVAQNQFRIDTSGNIILAQNIAPVLVGTFTSTGTASQKLQVTGGAYVSGSVGIGTTNPSDKLHTLGGNVRVDSLTGALNFWNGAGYYGGIGVANGLGGSGTDIVIRADTARSIIFFTGGVNDRGRIDSSGTFLVGSATSTGTASQRLQVSGGGYFSGTVAIGLTNPAVSVGSSARLNIQTSDGTRGIRIQNDSASHYAELHLAASAREYRIGVGGASVGDLGNSFYLYDTNAGSTRLLLNSSGNLGINSTNPTSKLTVVGDATITNPGAAALAVRSGASGSYASFNIGRTTNEVSISVAGNAGEFANNASAGDLVIRTETASAKILFTNGATNSTLAVANNNVLVGSVSSTGTASQPLQVSGGAYFSGSVGIGTTIPTGGLTIATVGSATTGASQIYLNGATSNRIDFNINGVAVPATGRSAGTKIVLYPSLTGGIEYAIGVEPNHIWQSVPAGSTAGFKWYGGTTELAVLKGNGNLGIGTTNPLGILQVGIGTSAFVVTGIGSVGIGTTNPTSALTISRSNTTTIATGSHLNLENSAANAQTTLAFTFNGLVRSSLRSDGSNFVLNTNGNAFYFNNDYGSNTFGFLTGGFTIPWLQVSGGNKVGIATNSASATFQVKDALAFETTNTTTTTTSQVAVDSFGITTFRSAKYQVQVTCPGQISTLGGITTGGRGYTAGTFNVTFTTSSGNGSAAQGTLVVSNGTVGIIGLGTTGGSGYVTGDVLTAAGGSGLQVSVASTASPTGRITGLTLTSAGIGYTAGVGVGTTTLTLLGGTGTGAVGLATIFDGVITSSTLLQQPTTGTGGTVFYSGSNYSTASVLSVTRSDLTNTITTITGSVGVSTFTSLTAHGIGVSDVVRVSSTSNGLTAGTDYYVVTVPTTTTFTLGSAVGVGRTFTAGTSLSIGFFRNSANAGGQVAYTNAITGVSTNFQASDLMVLQNGTTADFIEYATIANNDILGTFAADISGSNARLLFTPTYPDNTVKVARQAITV